MGGGSTVGKLSVLIVAILLSMTVACGQSASESESETTEPDGASIMELMTVIITPASDTLWGVDDPQTDAEWQVLTDAANTLIAAFEQAKTGGTGPNDKKWANDARWPAYVDEEMAALESAKSAIDARDIDKLFDANNDLYTPCESCHIDFNPGVSAEPQ